MKHNFFRYCVALQVLLMGIARCEAQSDISMATHWYNRANYNPASIVRNNYIYLFSNVRQQWLGVDGAPTVFNVQASGLNYAYHSAFGISLVSDHIGVSQAINPMCSYAYRLGASEDSWLALGISAGVFARFVDVSALEASTQTDATVYSIAEKKIAPDINIGTEWQSPAWTVGLSATHVPSVFKGSDDYLNSTYMYSYLQYKNTNSELFNYSVGVLSTVGNSKATTEFNGLLRVKHPTGLYGGNRELFDVGLSYSTAKQASLLLGLNISANFRVGYAFVQTFSTGYSANSTHEVMLEYRILSPKASACHCHSESSWYY